MSRIIAALACLWWIHGAAAFAQGLQISPISVQMLAGQRTTTFVITNQNDTPVAVQLRAFAWDQNSPQEGLAPTNDIAVSPPMAEIAAKDSQLFRVLLRRPATRGEASYRLVFDQLPNTADPASSGIRVMLRISVPVFVEPNTQVGSDVAWHIVPGPRGATLVGSNRGTSHIRVFNPAITRPDGQKLALQPELTPYILPGAARSWIIRDNGQLRPGSKVHLTATSDQGSVDAMVDVVPP